MILSFVAYGAVLLALLHHSRPVFVMPSDIAVGTPGSSGRVIYLARNAAESAIAAHENPSLLLRAPTPKPPRIDKPLPVIHENENATAGAQATETASGGSLYGARIPGARLTGYEIIPALPQVFPDPAISRADLSPGVRGDVIVEVTIDDHGNVIESKLISGIGYGIEDGVLATLRQWHSRPASKDGVNIATKHIVTFRLCAGI